jgi:hypothetical protein
VTDLDLTARLRGDIFDAVPDDGDMQHVLTMAAAELESLRDKDQSTARPAGPGLNPRAIHVALGVDRWAVPHAFGPTGMVFDTISSRPTSRSRIIITDGETPHSDEIWRHASISRPLRDPDYEELAHLKLAVWGEDGYAYQVFAGAAEHVNIHEHALHLWGTPDGRRHLPAFGANGSI